MTQQNPEAAGLPADGAGGNPSKGGGGPATPQSPLQRSPPSTPASPAAQAPRVGVRAVTRVFGHKLGRTQGAVERLSGGQLATGGLFRSRRKQTGSAVRSIHVPCIRYCNGPWVQNFGTLFPIFVCSSVTPCPTGSPVACADTAVAPQAAAAVERRQIPYRAASAAGAPVETGALQLHSALRHCLLGLATSCVCDSMPTFALLQWAPRQAAPLESLQLHGIWAYLRPIVFGLCGLVAFRRWSHVLRRRMPAAARHPRAFTRRVSTDRQACLPASWCMNVIHVPIEQ